MKRQFPYQGKASSAQHHPEGATAENAPVLYDAKDIRDIVRRMPLRPADNPVRFAQATLETAMEIFIGKSCLIRYSTLSEDTILREALALRKDTCNALKTRDCLIGNHQFNIQFLEALLSARDFLLSGLTGDCRSCKHTIDSQSRKIPSAFCAKFNKPLPSTVSAVRQQQDFATTLMATMAEPRHLQECFEPKEKDEILCRITASNLLIEKQKQAIQNTKDNNK